MLTPSDDIVVTGIVNNVYDSSATVDVDTTQDAERSYSDLQCSLSWENINVSVRNSRRCLRRRKQHETPILTNVSGFVAPGSLLAILGSSGAGKTTLLNVLTDRFDPQKFNVTGSVKVSGQDIKGKISDLSVYVEQHDAFLGLLTVREHLVFRAHLGMSSSFTNAEKEERVDEVIKDLGLLPCANTRIGVPGRISGISGGQRRRLSFASEILKHPTLMFCDEVTTGLDSYTAQTIVETLKYLSQRGITIVCTIHQPPSEVFALFDNILLMALGRVAFMGSASNAIDFFNSQGFSCPVNFNPADFYIQTLAVVPSRAAESETKIMRICDEFDKSEIGTLIHSEIAHANQRPMANINFKDLRLSTAHVWWVVEFWYCFWRSIVTIWREPVVIRMKFVISILFAVVLGLFFLNTKYDQNGIQNINGLIFMLLIQNTFPYMLGVANLFIEEMPVIIRDHKVKLYRLSSYYAAKNIADLPHHIIFPIIGGAIIYWMSGLYRDVVHFLIFEGVIVLVANCASGFAYIFSVGTRDITVALNILPTLALPIILLGGFFLNAATNPVYLDWLSYLSWIRYSFQLLIVNQWDDVTNITCSHHPCISTGAQVIRQLNFSADDTVFNIGLLVALVFGFRVIGFVVFSLKLSKLSCC